MAWSDAARRAAQLARSRKRNFTPSVVKEYTQRFREAGDRAAATYRRSKTGLKAAKAGSRAYGASGISWQTPTQSGLYASVKRARRTIRG